MIGTTAAIIGGALAAGGSVAGSAIAASGANSAAKTQAKAAENATELQQQIYEKNIELQKPWYEAGQAALNRLMALSGFMPQAQSGNMPQQYGYQPATSAISGQSNNALIPLVGELQRLEQLRSELKSGPPGMKTWSQLASVENQIKRLKKDIDNAGGYAALMAQSSANASPAQWSAPYAETPEQILSMDPSYQWRLAQGQKALERSAAARGNALSGAAIKASERYGQDYASNEYANVWNRLASIAGLGQAASNTIGSYGQGYANQAGDLMTQAANARASGYVSGGNIWGNTIAGLPSIITDIYTLSRGSKP